MSNARDRDSRKRHKSSDLPGWKAYVELGGARYGAKLHSVFYDHHVSGDAAHVACILCASDGKYRVVTTDQRMKYQGYTLEGVGGWGNIEGYPTAETAIIAWRLKNGR